MATRDPRECKVCTYRYTVGDERTSNFSPLVIPACGHSICKTCARKMETLNKRDLKCPVCRLEFDSVRSCVPNYDLIALLAATNDDSSSNSSSSSSSSTAAHLEERASWEQDVKSLNFKLARASSALERLNNRLVAAEVTMAAQQEEIMLKDRELSRARAWKQQKVAFAVRNAPTTPSTPVQTPEARAMLESLRAMRWGELHPRSGLRTMQVKRVGERVPVPVNRNPDFIYPMDTETEAMPQLMPVKREDYMWRLKKAKKEEEGDEICIVCGSGEDADKMLLCDGDGCDSGYHIFCLTPPLSTIPPGDWYCQMCEKKKKRRQRPKFLRVRKQRQSFFDSIVSIVSTPKRQDVINNYPDPMDRYQLPRASHDNKKRKRLRGHLKNNKAYLQIISL